MINNETKDAILKDISRSKEFQDADIYMGLLQYLLQMAQKSKIPKEKDIARDVLQKGDSFDPLIDTSVRVYMYRLRKRLENYYQNEGKSSKIQLVIPKGEYFIEFRPKLPSLKTKNIFLNSPLIIVTILWILSLATMAYLWSTNRALRSSVQTIHENDEIWGSFIGNGLPTLLVFGDHFFFASRENNDPATEMHLRYHKVNSMKELQDFIAAQNNDKNIKYFKDSDYFLDRYCSWSLMHILPIFYSYKKDVTLKIASELRWNDFNNYNILFVGSFKTLGILDSVFGNLNITYELFPLPNKIIIKDSLQTRPEVLYTFMSKSEPFFQREYSYLAKIPGPNHNVILMMIGFNYIGVENAVKLVTQADLLSQCKQDIKKELGELPPYFEILYQVQGFEKTTMYSNFIKSYRIPNDYNISQSRP